MGGYIANIFSVAYDFPALLFNPALAFRSIDIDMEEPFDNIITSPTYVVLGRQDDVIDCGKNLSFIKEHCKGPKEIYLEENMGHRIPLDIFEKHAASFFEYLDEYHNLFRY